MTFSAAVLAGTEGLDHFQEKHQYLVFLALGLATFVSDLWGLFDEDTNLYHFRRISGSQPHSAFIYGGNEQSTESMSS
jgi:hypothetical protein